MVRRSWPLVPVAISGRYLCRLADADARLATAGLATLLLLGLAACASTTGPAAPGPVQDFANYRTQPQPRAFAVTGGTLDNSANYATGWSDDAATVEDAIQQALSECERYRNPGSQPECQLYAIGDLVVVHADTAERQRAICLADLDQPGGAAGQPLPEACASLEARLQAAPPAAPVPLLAEPTPAAPATPPATSAPAAASPAAAQPSRPAAMAEPGAGPPMYRVVADVNLRKGPGNDYPRVGVLHEGEQIQVGEQELGWFEVVRGGDSVGYVYRTWLDVAD